MKLVRAVALPFCLLALAACGDKSGASASASASGSGAPTSTSSGSGSSAAAAATSAPKTETPAAPKGVATKGEVKGADGKKIAYSIELPEGLKDVSDNDVVKMYGKDAKNFEGVTFQVSRAHEEWVKGGLDKTLGELQKSPDFTKNEAKIVDKNTFDNGWYFVATIVEGGKKKAVLLTSVITKDGKAVACRGNVEGPEADNPDKVVPVLIAGCKSLKIE
ncbi:MAG: hypothetical protein HOW73_50500 [Polyangiaceae bacterium]|nr:hypothetical protein [Polyangiaceae bacterium]